MQQIDQALTLMLNGSNSLFIDGIAWTATQTSTWLPLLLVLIYVIIQGNNMKGVVSLIIGGALCILLADQVASSIFKPLVERWRPTHNPFIMYSVDIVNGYRGGNYGFFSSHAANTMSIATFFSLIFRNKKMCIWLYSWVLLNCWSRVYLGVHYIGDLMAGLLWGGTVGYVIYRVMKYKKWINTETHTIKGEVVNVNYNLHSMHELIATLILSYAFILFKAMFFS